ncbi:hypothetical protein AWB72_04044 [Caballeronia concitans]|uniref:Uncharacterized protein n=1 Tax=Caballeronia concitans TaxID=1777133 RepID=A0A658R1B0_9BURK|nr:hypothetical protein BurMR1_0922 [Burkholderia sp. MR1]SAL39186.1 hypothetical protein AWB72_04044 [Caballeronia concitans]
MRAPGLDKTFGAQRATRQQKFTASNESNVTCHAPILARDLSLVAQL